MKKLVVLLMLVLLARIPLSEWQKIPDQNEFLTLLAGVFAQKFECQYGAVVGVMELGEEAVFFGDCVQKGDTRL